MTSNSWLVTSMKNSQWCSLVRQVCSLSYVHTLDLRRVQPSRFHGSMAMCMWAMWLSPQNVVILMNVTNAHYCVQYMHPNSHSCVQIFTGHNFHDLCNTAHIVKPNFPACTVRQLGEAIAVELDELKPLFFLRQLWACSNLLERPGHLSRNGFTDLCYSNTQGIFMFCFMYLCCSQKL